MVLTLRRVHVRAGVDERLDDRQTAVRAAVISAVSPVGNAAIGSAPAFSSRSIIGTLR